MTNQVNLPPPTHKPSNLKFLVACLTILARATFAVLILVVLIAALPLQPWQAVWYLKIGQIAIDYSISLFFALFLEALAKHFKSKGAVAFKKDNFLPKLVLVSFILYAALVPIQLFSGGLQWLQTNQLGKQAILQAETESVALIKRIRSSKSDAELQAALGNPSPMPQAPNSLPTLGQRDQLIEAINNRILQLRTRVKNERKQQLAALGIGITKGVVGAGMIAFAMSRLRKVASLL